MYIHSVWRQPDIAHCKYLTLIMIPKITPSTDIFDTIILKIMNVISVGFSGLHQKYVKRAE